ncbi:MAG: dTMP kinase [Candidatus Omnitrophota bacterium]
MAQKSLKKGLFISFEGPEGSGKSTHAGKIYGFLSGLGYKCMFTREPGGTFVGEKIREILLDPKHKEISGLAELLLFETNRSQLLEEVIKPAIRRRMIVLCDRYSDSTIVYQGYAGELPVKDVEAVDRIATSGIKPDLTILLDVPAGTGLARAAARRPRDRMEMKPLGFHRKVRNGYIRLAGKNKKRIKVIKVRADIQETYELVKKEIMKAVRRREK